MKTGALLLGLLVLSCGGEKVSGKNEHAALGGEAAARVDGAPIPLELVTAVAAEQHISLSEALRHLVDDAVSAAGARTRGLDREEPATWQLTAARGRWVADQLMADARAGGPPTKEEIDELTQLHWRQVDRPPGYRVVHALAMRPKNAADIPHAKEIAQQLRQAVLPAKDEADFLARAKAVPHPAEIDTRAESLPTFSSEGKGLEGEGDMDEQFAHGAASLKKAGETSGIVETKFGWHVIRLLETLPEQRMSYDARATAFTEEAYQRRARKGLEARLGAATSKIEISPSAEGLMASLALRRPSP